MSVLFGHPTGTPFSHHAALAHYEAGWLESFCVPWIPSAAVLGLLRSIPPLRGPAQRLARRRFAPLADVPTTQGRLPELRRLLLRMMGGDNDVLVGEANAWLMRTMAVELSRSRVTAIHTYEDCALTAFEAARRQARACVYDLPIGYYAAWLATRRRLGERYVDWVAPEASVGEDLSDRLKLKSAEVALADLVLAPSRFVSDTVQAFHPAREVFIAPYGVDLEAWPMRRRDHGRGPLVFLFAGQCSVRKGVPLLLEAWRRANLQDAELRLVGSWRLSEARKRDLPTGVSWEGPVSAEGLRARYAEADVFVFPTNFEGRALVVLEALASGLPVITTRASGADDAVGSAGLIVPPDDCDAVVHALRWCASNRDDLPALSRAARVRAEECTWEAYRRSVVQAVRSFV